MNRDALGNLDATQQHDRDRTLRLPTTFIGEAIAHHPHGIANVSPFCTTTNTDILNRQDGKEQVFVGPVTPILVHDAPLMQCSTMHLEGHNEARMMVHSG